MSARPTKSRPQSQTHRSAALVPAHVAPWISDSDGFRLDAWALEAPDLEYIADGVELSSFGGLQSLYFWQAGPSGNPLSMVAISIAPGNVKSAVESFEEIKKNIFQKVPIWFRDVVAPRAELGNIPPERHRRFLANVLRAASSEDAAMLDFYNVELYTVRRQQATNGGAPPLVRDLLRVWVTPPVLARMLKLLEGEES